MSASQVNHDDVNAKQQIMVSWTLPLSGYVKINSDGACKGGLRAGCGGLIIGEAGEWLCSFSKFLGKCSAYVAEMWGVLESLRLAWRYGFSKVEVHVDSKVVVKNLTSNGDVVAAGFWLVQKILQLLELDWEVKVCHTYCKANFCVDA